MPGPRATSPESWSEFEPRVVGRVGGSGRARPGGPRRGGRAVAVRRPARGGDAMTDEVRYFPLDRLREFTARVFAQLGMPAAADLHVAGDLAAAEARPTSESAERG